MREGKLWYAVQKDSEDDWGYGSYNYEEAVDMLNSYDGYTLIAVIDNDVCIREIRKEDL